MATEGLPNIDSHESAALAVIEGHLEVNEDHKETLKAPCSFFGRSLSQKKAQPVISELVDKLFSHVDETAPDRGSEDREKRFLACCTVVDHAVSKDLIHADHGDLIKKIISDIYAEEAALAVIEGHLEANPEVCFSKKVTLKVPIQQVPAISELVAEIFSHVDKTAPEQGSLKRHESFLACHRVVDHAVSNDLIHADYGDLIKKLILKESGNSSESELHEEISKRTTLQKIGIDKVQPETDTNDRISRLILSEQYPGQNISEIKELLKEREKDYKEYLSTTLGKLEENLEGGKLTWKDSQNVNLKKSPHRLAVLLMEVSPYGAEHLIKALLESEHITSKMLDTPDADGKTPLIEIARNGSNGSIKALLESDKVTPEMLKTQNKIGRTPVMEMIFFGG